jgi:hypothetical protein
MTRSAAQRLAATQILLRLALAAQQAGRHGQAGHFLRQALAQ